MSYLTALVINFLALIGLVRFAPGLATAYAETSSPPASDILFSLVTSLCNVSVFPLLILLRIFPTKLKLAALNGIISFGAFSLVAIIPYGFQPDAGGAAIGGSLIWLVSFLTSYFQMRRWIDTHHSS